MKKLSMAVLCIMSALTLTLGVGTTSVKQPVEKSVQYIMKSEPGGL